MSVLLLVRHGQASWGEADYDRQFQQGARLNLEEAIAYALDDDVSGHSPPD